MERQFIGQQVIQPQVPTQEPEVTEPIPAGRVILEVPIDEWENMMEDFGVLKP